MATKEFPAAGTVLRHVEVLTRQVDASLLNVSTLTSLCELLGLQQIRFFDVIQHHGALYSALAAWPGDGRIECNNELPLESDLLPVAQHEALASCLGSGQASAVKVRSAQGYTYYLPVLVGERPIAYFEIQTGQELTTHQIDVSEGVLGVYRNYFCLLKDSQHDTLTGLLNRKTFDRGLLNVLALSDADARQQRGADAERRSSQGNAHWLAIVDIDHFKRINDQYGHLYGDEVLILMANLLRKSFRQQDKLYRFGGEEFVVLMNYVTFDSASASLERFRNTVANHAFPQVGKVTASIGFAPIQSMQLGAMVLGNADEALYYAKSHGRNQVRCYSTLVAAGDLAAKVLHSDAELF